MSLSKKRIFLRNTSILHLSPKLPHLGVGGHEIYNFLSPYPTDATFQIWLILAQKVFIRRCWRTTHDGRRLTSTYSNRSPELLRWPRYENVRKNSQIRRKDEKRKKYFYHVCIHVLVYKRVELESTFIFSQNFYPNNLFSPQPSPPVLKCSGFASESQCIYPAT